MFMGMLQELFRWLHIAAGIMWIGHLYFFNFVNAPFGPTMDAGTRQKVVPELMPRALFWFRWGALWTWVTGLLLLLLVFYHGGAVLGTGQSWSVGTVVMILVSLLAFFIYDPLAKSGAGKDLRMLGGIGLVLVLILILAFQNVGGFGDRGTVIHVGATFGTIMLLNVWMRIWPAQQKIITAIKQGTAPDAALVALAGARSRHNTYLSVPLVWTMINAHTSAIFTGATGIVVLFIAIVAGWALVYWLYTKSAAVKGF
jgi:uncharacterized membrane protein